MQVVDERVQILNAERRRQLALVNVDLVALDDLFAEDLVHVHSTGLVHNKTQLLQHIARKRGFIAIEREHMDIRIEGNIAVMTGAITNHMHGAGENSEIVMRGYVTQVLRRYADAWRFTNFQLTVIAESLASGKTPATGQMPEEKEAK